MEHELTTTATELPGYRITENLGVVRGVVVRSRSALGNIGASIQMFFGGNITLLEELCERAREEALQKAIGHAEEIGGNAIVALRYDATEIMEGATEVLCYGTAVVVEPVKEG
ncbi:MAG TPA: heavy metal-binding domain-containing protein [Candidatus Methylacidiphilales bacterium]